ncbi:DUF4301 family protein [Alkalitalea saponilacus]|uniref:DUF4301 domain-containing protein n=1 Tax=Alkalitalea saponilacus TaxID=889453 RepID=A0A1T5HCI3_9BACT|nr:DUF4301 family protein [Alkalitalea saponilacus]ASB50747.1 hypothetical protein CDL62_17115 [Alkalitalea saponilacus]SKC18393.1 protein of unknown function [Alkalitalea saponilacus]
MILSTDYNTLEQKGITEDQLKEQITRFNEGFPALEIIRPAIPNNGITILNASETEKYANKLKDQIESGISVSKFVPASGAATRMFKDLYQYLENPVPLKTLEINHPVVKFIELLPRFAFFGLIQEKLKIYNLNNVHVRKSRAEDIIKAVLGEEGLNYGQLPKGLIHFHKYENDIRTAMEEHLAEGASYALNKNGLVNIHFTVSPEHHELFKEMLYQKGPLIENRFDVGLDVSFSFQKPHTDTLAVTPDNEPFRDENGQLVFRPGGHGALIENLNEQNAELIFVKNIDNVVPEHLLNTTISYKKALGGMLLEVKETIFSFLEQLEKAPAQITIERIIKFINEQLSVKLPENFPVLSDDEKVSYLKGFLNRPMRVCGMVKNEGEPGGGPFIIKEQSGQESLQILESSQINMDDLHQVKQLKSATHFNPVDLVCYVKNYKGAKFDLTKYIDPQTGFISEKSLSGRPLKALELPGLWNGAMANWITLFVEVPIETFNPVKTVNDLLRPQHQPTV